MRKSIVREGKFLGVVLVTLVLTGGVLFVGASATLAAKSTKIKIYGHKVMTTVFYVGEPADESNDYIANNQSAWDEQWQQHFGGIDDWQNRCGFNPCGFTPKENPFYFALPYGDYTEDGMKASAKLVPWYGQMTGQESVLKNRWIKVSYRGKSCYGQWEDVGPNEDDDFSYVFGNSKAKPKNTFGMKAGLDISPAMYTCLRMKDNAVTTWKFVDFKKVPRGPWKKTITTSGVTWR